jgi:hypothetical protein
MSELNAHRMRLVDLRMAATLHGWRQRYQLGGTEQVSEKSPAYDAAPFCNKTH